MEIAARGRDESMNRRGLAGTNEPPPRAIRAESRGGIVLVWHRTAFGPEPDHQNHATDFRAPTTTDIRSPILGDWRATIISHPNAPLQGLNGTECPIADRQSGSNVQPFDQYAIVLPFPVLGLSQLGNPGLTCLLRSQLGKAGLWIRNSFPPALCAVEPIRNKD